MLAMVETCFRAASMHLGNLIWVSALCRMQLQGCTWGHQLGIDHIYGRKIQLCPEPKVSECNGKRHRSNSQQGSPDMPFDWWDECAGRVLARRPAIAVPMYAYAALHAARYGFRVSTGACISSAEVYAICCSNAAEGMLISRTSPSVERCHVLGHWK